MLTAEQAALGAWLIASLSDGRRGGWIHLYAVTGPMGRNAQRHIPGWIKPCSRQSRRIHKGAVSSRTKLAGQWPENSTNAGRAG